MNPWRFSHHHDPGAVAVADRHYSRQKVGANQFVAPGACVVLVAGDYDAVWVTLQQYPPYVKHAWRNAWVNSFFRRERGDQLASELIAAAVARTRARWHPPADGIVSFIDPSCVKHKRDPGRCYRKAGWRHVGYTPTGLWVYQQLPAEMPAADYSEMHPLFEAEMSQPHHCSTSDYLSLVAWLRAIEAGHVSPLDVDWRTKCGVIALMMEHALAIHRDELLGALNTLEATWRKRHEAEQDYYYNGLWEACADDLARVCETSE